MGGGGGSGGGGGGGGGLIEFTSIRKHIINHKSSCQDGIFIVCSVHWVDHEDNRVIETYCALYCRANPSCMGTTDSLESVYKFSKVVL